VEVTQCTDEKAEATFSRKTTDSYRHRPGASGWSLTWHDLASIKLKKVMPAVDAQLTVLEDNGTHQLSSNSEPSDDTTNVAGAIAVLRSMGVAAGEISPIIPAGTTTFDSVGPGAWLGPDEFEAALETAALSKADVLSKAQPGTRHLFVWVTPYHPASLASAKSGTEHRPLDLPASIDVVWAACLTSSPPTVLKRWNRVGWAEIDIVSARRTRRGE
jgi:hypothetical protein